MRIFTKHETNLNRDVEVVVSKDQIDTFNKDGVILIKTITPTGISSKINIVQCDVKR
jgi:hypothetical protein